MKFRCTESLGLATFCLLVAGAAGQKASGDPYAPLRLYEGAWEVQVTTPEKKTDKIVNHCAKTGTFFSCEQEVNGKNDGPGGISARGENHEWSAGVPHAGATTRCQRAAGLEPAGDRRRHMALFVGQQGSWKNNTLAKHKSFYRQGSDPF